MKSRLVSVCVLTFLCSFAGSISVAIAEPWPELEVNQCKLEETGSAEAELPADVLEAAIFQSITCSTVADCPCAAPACACIQSVHRCICQISLCCMEENCP